MVTQAHYTIRTSGGDLNLCRAYMPFKCRHFETGIEYDPFDPDHKAHYNDKRPDGTSVWLDENGQGWIPSDLHSVTTMKAYPDVDPTSPAFKKEYRPKGKMTNFASNYGAGAGALVDQLNISFEEAEKLLNGYKEAFPHVIIYQDMIQKAHSQKGYVSNHYGRRYYLQDGSKAYRLANYVVQGSCADALKESIVRLDSFLKDTRSRIVMPIHDELIFKFHKDEQHLKEQVLKIMQDSFDWCIVPVTAGIEETTTTWKEKR